MIVIRTFANRDGDFKEQHAFIGYQRDTAAAVVFQACRQLKQFIKEPTRCRALRESGILDDIQCDELYEDVEVPSETDVGSKELPDTMEECLDVKKKRRKHRSLEICCKLALY